ARASGRRPGGSAPGSRPYAFENIQRATCPRPAALASADAADRPRRMRLATRASTAADLDTDVLLEFLAAFKAGDFTARMPASWTGPAGKVADTLNDVIEKNQRFSQELQRLG